MAVIAHVAYWVADMDRSCSFWAEWFGASAGPLYASTNQPGFTSRFLTFSDGATIELMHRPNLSPASGSTVPAVGLAHIAISLGSVAAVDSLAAKARLAGVLAAEPRRTGDGFYEAILIDPDRNQIEITA